MCTGVKPAGWCCGSRSTAWRAAATAEESVSVDDCARVSRDLSALLDVEDASHDLHPWRSRRPA